MNIRVNHSVRVAVMILPALALLACQPSEMVREEPAPIPAAVDSGDVAFATTHLQDSPIVWAVNLGGGRHVSADGIDYQADQLVMDAERGQIEVIKGAQDDEVFKTFRTGEISLSKALPNGNYDIGFRFAEPQDIPVGARSFDIVAENQVVIDTMDVRLARDGNSMAALERCVTGIEVRDGVLDIQFREKQGEPILNAVVVRKSTPRADHWQLSWSDEFDYQGQPDPERWSYDIWPAAKVNREDQAYTDRPDNVRVEDGRLIIEAHRENYQGAEYTSGRIHSADKGDFLYGRAEVRAKLPAGQGTWAAIWMLPTDPFKYASNCQAGEDWQGSDSCDAWPNSGEIDIMEHVGYDMNIVHGTVHTRAYYWVNGEQRKASVDAKNAEQEFHTYAVEWSPERIDIFFDDSLYFSYMNQGEGWQAWPFDHPYHLILNLAIGGDWGRAGGPIDNSIFPVQMEVDYVRVYQPEQQISSRP